ncbi:MAG: bifunctional UDP-N-acetylglucosamine diphosphorylase/glucosamine-1-phosphate N-acetyltransferase GlmU [Acidobacteria bacterium]|nr:bifunctional UDP-N-acetylglucosamine diphosphorylase/glucosamine-1-phosphate N-acetyltransferase GlmU [Acidobacteriota bacterium]
MTRRRSSPRRPLAAVVLAAGEGKRFRSARPKVLHELCGKPLLAYALEAAAPLRAERTVVIVGRGADDVAEAAGGLTRRPLEFALQARQLGTADAARMAGEALGRFDGDVLIIPADVPLLEVPTLRRLVARHRRARAAATVLTAVVADPTGYGRIVRDAAGLVSRIVEHGDATPAERAIPEVNSSVWVFDRAALRAALTKVGRGNRQREFYLTDVVEILRDKGETVEALAAAEATEILGVNSRSQLARAGALLRARINERWMAAGVTIVHPALTYIDAGVRIGRDTVVHPLTFLSGATRIGSGCEIGPAARLRDSVVAGGARVVFSVLDRARVGPGANVGPYAYLRPGARLDRGAKAGTFVEIKGSTVGRGSKVPHLSYVGDALIGPGVNVGAGTITCNYDGERKHRTVVGAGAFIGSDTMLVAPVKVGRGAYTGAGSAITRDVPAGALAVERAEQRNVRGWAARRAAKAQTGPGQGSGPRASNKSARGRTGGARRPAKKST